MMKSIFPIFMLLFQFLLCFGQHDNIHMQIHRNGDVVASYEVNEVDSITFGKGIKEDGTSKSGISIQRVYGDGTTYCAFTSLIKRDGIYYLAFREAQTHVAPGDYGVIRIMTSSDGDTWEMHQTLTVNEVDLRDPDLSIRPNGQMMLICGARIFDEEKNVYVTRTYCSLEDTRGEFNAPTEINLPIEVIWDTCSWVWRVTWNEGVGYGVCYGGGNICLLKTEDGLNYEIVTPLSVTGNPNECQIRFANDGTAYMMVRCSQGAGQPGYMGKSKYPYVNWDWEELNIYLAGQDFLIDKESLIVVTRMTQNIGDRTVVWFGSSTGDFNWCYTLPFGGESGKGDTAYAGILNDGNTYWISYYAIHEGEKPSIYIVKLLKKMELIP